MLKKRIDSFKFAFKGIAELLKSHTNFKIHIALALLAIAAGFYLEISNSEWLIIILCILIVFMAEGFNTAIEFVVDLASPEKHPLAAKAKDVAAASVLIAAIGSAIIGMMIFIPKLGLI